MIYENISRLCEKKGISIKEFERRAGLKNGMVGKWRKAKPRIDSLQKAADFFGVTVNYLLREVKEESEQ